jgi:predicted Rossmann-fold nucleotide-binding protein
VLVGSDFWAGLVDWIRDTLLAAGNIDKEDMLLLKVLDEAEEVISFIRKTVIV